MTSIWAKDKLQEIPPLTLAQDQFLAECTREYNEKLERLRKDWSFSNYKTWGFDQLSGLFFLELADGSRVEADGQAIGSYMPEKNSWEWAWNNPNVEPAMKQDIQFVKAYGEKEKLEYLRKGIVAASNNHVPVFLSAIAIKILGSEGVFAGTAGPVQVFLSLKRLRRKSA